MMPSAPMPRRRSASRRTCATESRTASSGSRTTRKSLPAPSCLVACTDSILAGGVAQPCTARARSSSSWASAHAGGPGDARVAPEPRGLAAGELPGAPDRLLDAVVRAGRPPPRGPGSRGSRAPGGPCATALPARAARAAPRRPSPPRPSPRTARAMRRSISSGGTARARPGRRPWRGRPRGPGPKSENGRPAPSVTSRARTTRRRLVGSMRRRPDRVERGQAGVQIGRLGPPVVQLGLQRRRHVGVAARNGQIVDDGREDTARCPRRAGRGARAPRCRPARRGPPAGTAATVKSSSGRPGRRGGAARRPVPPASAWTSRCPCPGRRTWSRPRRSRSRRGAGPAPERGLRLARGGDADQGDCGQAPATGMRTRCRGGAVTSSSRPERWCGWPAVTVTRPSAPGRRVAGGARRRKVDQLALAGTAAQHGLVAAADALDEHLLAAARPGPGGGPGPSGRSPS